MKTKKSQTNNNLNSEKKKQEKAATAKPKKYKKIKSNNAEKRLVTEETVKREKRNRIISKIFNGILVIILPIILVFLGAIIQRETAVEAINWISNNQGMFILNVCFIYLIFFVTQLIFNSSSWGFGITSILYLAFPIISKLKYDIRGEVLLVNDLSLAGNMEELSKFVEFSDRLMTQLILIFLLVVFVTCLIVTCKIKVNRKSSAIYSALFLAIFLVSFVIPFSSEKVLRFAGINNDIRFSPNITHSHQGTWLGIYSNFLMNTVSEPSRYSREYVYKILSTAEEQYNLKNTNKKSKNEKQPNIIVIMSESFFDPLTIPNVEFSEDPIANTRKLLEKCESGKMISSTFGGGTSSIEFEAFTGEPVCFLPYGTVPYTDLTPNLSNVQTIQKLLKDQGYSIVGLHDYIGTFYNREEAYPNIGFDIFKDSSKLSVVQYYGKYISDYSLFENIKSELLKAKEENKPAFIWGLTMQNHTPYQTSNYTEGFDKVKIQSDFLTDIAYDKLLAYVNGIYESDQQMKNLIEYFDSLEEPVVMLFYGDHLPSLYEVYYDTGMIESKDTTVWSTKEMLNMHTVPFFIYDNYSKTTSRNHDNIVGAAQLGNLLLNYANVEKTSYFKFLDTLNYKAIRDRLFVDDDGNAYDSITKECNAKSEEHKLLVYDMIYGKNYVKDYENEK